MEKEEVPVAEIIEFLSLIEYVRPDLRDAERERENYEVTYQVSWCKHSLHFICNWFVGY